MERGLIVAEARAWIGTPYTHQASLRGVGCDCLGLVRGVWRALIGPEPEPLPAYTPDWADVTGVVPLHRALHRWFTPVPWPQPGDLVGFAMRPGGGVKHLALVSGPGTLVHAYWGRAVVESRFGGWWRSRLAYAGAFPGVADG